MVLKTVFIIKIDRNKFFSLSFAVFYTMLKLLLIHKPRIFLKHCLSSQQYISPVVATALIKWQSSLWKRKDIVGILHFKLLKSIHRLDNLLHKNFNCFQNEGLKFWLLIRSTRNNTCLLKNSSQRQGLKTRGPRAFMVTRALSRVCQYTNKEHVRWKSVCLGKVSMCVF